MLTAFYSLGLISGGSMSDNLGWRWSQTICGIGFAVVLFLFAFSFEETLFPRFLFQQESAPVVAPSLDAEVGGLDNTKTSKGNSDAKLSNCASQSNGIVDEFPKRTYFQLLKPWMRYPQNKTSFWQYFRRPFFLWTFPNVVIVSNHFFKAPDKGGQ